MAQPAANLRVRISADLSDIKQGLGLLRGELAKVKSQAATALPANNNAFVSSLRSARTQLAAFAATYLSLRGASVLAGLADEATQLRGRIRNAKGDYEAILAIANETRTGLAATADLYTRVERSTRGQIKNQGDLLQLTKSVNQAIKLSYTGTAQGEAAVLQLGQALSSGRLGGDELKSISENAPRLAQAIAQGLGVAQGALRKMGKEGELTTKVVIEALKTQAAVLEEEYKQVPATISDAFTQLRNSLVDYVGDQDAATGSSRKFAETIREIAKDLPRYLDPVLKVLTLILQNLDVLAVFMVTRMVGAAIPAMITAFTALKVAIITTGASVTTLRAALMLLGGPVGIILAALAAAFYLLWKRTNDAKVAAEEHTRAMNDNKNLAYQSRDAALADAKAKRIQALATLQAARAVLEEKKARQSDTSSKFARGGDRGDGAALSASNELDNAYKRQAQAQQEFDDWGKRLVALSLEISEAAVAGTTDASEGVAETVTNAGKAVAASNALIRDSIARALKELDRMYADSEIGATQYFTTRQQLQEKAIDADIEQAQAELAITKEIGARRKIEEDIVKLQRDRAEIGATTAREQAKAEEDLAEQLGNVKIKLLELDGDTAAAARAQLEGEYLELFKKLDKASDATGRAMVENLIDRLVSNAKMDELKGAADKITGALQETETALSAQASAGMIGQLEGERQIMVARQLALSQLQALRIATVESMSAMSEGSPEHDAAITGLQSIDTNIANITGSMQKYRQQVSDAAVDSVTNLFMDLVEGSKSAGEALGDFVRGFVLAMAQIAARALATFLVLQLLDAIYPGLGKATAATMSAGVHHAGGIAGAAGRMRSGLSPLLFGAAPRYHSGGIAGLGPNEVPAVLEKGEEVLTRNDPRHRNNGGGGADKSMVTTPIVAIGEEAIADAMAGAAGERIVLTHVRRNWGGLSRGT